MKTETINVGMNFYKVGDVCAIRNVSCQTTRIVRVIGVGFEAVTVRKLHWYETAWIWLMAHGEIKSFRHFRPKT